MLDNLIIGKSGKQPLTKGSSFKSEVKVIPLNFSNDSPTGTIFPLVLSSGGSLPLGKCQANIYVNFPVKEILVQNVICNTDDTALSGTVNANGLIMTNLFGGGAGYVGAVFFDDTYSSQLIHTVRHTFSVPKFIQGTYDFQLVNSLGVPIILTDGKKFQICVVLEFIYYDSEEFINVGQ